MRRKGEFYLELSIGVWHRMLVIGIYPLSWLRPRLFVRESGVSPVSGSAFHFLGGPLHVWSMSGAQGLLRLEIDADRDPFRGSMDYSRSFRRVF